jgi:hypothetical protein
MGRSAASTNRGALAFDAIGRGDLAPIPKHVDQQCAEVQGGGTVRSSRVSRAL